MRLPLGVRLLGRLRSSLGGSVADLDPAAVPAARERSGRIQAGPLGRAVVRRHERAVLTEDTVVAGADGVTLPVRVYRPPHASATPPPVVMNFHGGGFVQGDLDQSDWFCGRVAALAGAVVISVDYRLAPEHPFPTPWRDCYAATAAVAADAARWGVDPGRIHVMGDSAGGSLATVTCLVARDRRRRGEDAPRIAGQALIYPGVEMVDTLPSERAIPRAPILHASDIKGFSRLYMAGGDGTDAYASPLRADHTDLPPALVQVAEHDPLSDHGRLYATALRRAGVDVRLTEYQGACHGYISMPTLAPTVAHQAAWEVAHSVLASAAVPAA